MGILIGSLEDPNFAKAGPLTISFRRRGFLCKISYSAVNLSFKNDVKLIKNLVKCITREQVEGML